MEYISDAALDSYYRDTYKAAYGYDPLDPPTYDDLDVLYEEDDEVEDEYIEDEIDLEGIYA